MTTERPPEQSNGLVDQAAQLADDAIHATRRTSDLARRGANALREGSQSLRDGTVQAGDRATLYVKEEPLKAMLIAAATGAALMALVGLLTRSRDRG